MTRYPVTSSNVTSLGWEDGVLEVEFRRGVVYQYSGVPEGVYLDVLYAASPGKALMREVVGKYPETKIPPSTF